MGSSRLGCWIHVLPGGGVWQVNVGSKKYKVIPASVTYFHVQLGDEVTLIIPKVGESEWGAIENCLGKTQRKS